MLVQLQGPPLSNPTCLPTCIYFSYTYCIHHLPTSPTSYSTAHATARPPPLLQIGLLEGQQIGGSHHHILRRKEHVPAWKVEKMGQKTESEERVPKTCSTSGIE